MNGSRAYCRIVALSVGILLTAVIPQWALAQTKKGIELYDSGDYRQADRVLREALKANPSDTAGSYYLGLSELQQKNYGDALQIFLKVKQNQDRAATRPAIPSDYQIQIALARAHLGLKKYEEAWSNLESARIKNAGASDVYVYRGAYFLARQKYAEAIKELGKAIKLDADNPYAYYYEGLAYYGSGNGQKAVDDLKMFIQLFPNAPEAGEAKQLIDKLC